MRRYRVVIEPEAAADLEAIDSYIASEGNPKAAERFVAHILDLCGALESFPDRGSPRDDIREGLRSLAFRRRAVIFYMVDGNAVHVLGVAYAGRDPRTLMAGRGGGSS